MANELRNYGTMDDAEIAAAAIAGVCVVCGKSKASSVPFCATDYAALPLASRLALGNPEQRIGAFRSAWRHLELNQQRKREFNDWPYSQDDELYAAGYKWREHKRCEAPNCGLWISIWRAPNGNLIALDRFTRQPHRAQCADPDHFRKMREQRDERKRQERESRRLARLQTSARRKRRA